MAEENIIGSVDVYATLGVVGDVLLWSLIVLSVVGIIYLIWYLMSFKNTLIIRDAVNERKVVSKKNWKEKRDRNGNIWLITPFNRIKKALPPSKAIEITTKGRRWVEAWRGEDTETLIWIEDPFNYQTYKEQNPEFQPLTTQERELLINEISKSHEYKKKTTYELIVQISLIMAPIILIAVIGLVLGDITESLNAYSAPLTSTLDKVATSFETASENLAGLQTIRDANAENAAAIAETGAPN